MTCLFRGISKSQRAPLYVDWISKVFIVSCYRLQVKLKIKERKKAPKPVYSNHVLFLIIHSSFPVDHYLTRKIFLRQILLNFVMLRLIHSSFFWRLKNRIYRRPIALLRTCVIFCFENYNAVVTNKATGRENCVASHS